MEGAGRRIARLPASWVIGRTTGTAALPWREALRTGHTTKGDALCAGRRDLRVQYSMLDLFQGVSVGVDDEDYSEALSPHVNLTGRLGCFIHVSHIEMQVCGFIHLHQKRRAEVPR